MCFSAFYRVNIGCLSPMECNVIAVVYQALVPVYLSNPVYHRELDFQIISRLNCLKSIKAWSSKDGVVVRGCSDDKENYLDNGLEWVVSHSYDQGDHFLYLDSIPCESNQGKST